MNNLIKGDNMKEKEENEHSKASVTEEAFIQILSIIYFGSDN